MDWSVRDDDIVDSLQSINSGLNGKLIALTTTITGTLTRVTWAPKWLKNMRTSLVWLVRHVLRENPSVSNIRDRKAELGQHIINFGVVPCLISSLKLSTTLDKLNSSLFVPFYPLCSNKLCSDLLSLLIPTSYLSPNSTQCVPFFFTLFRTSSCLVKINGVAVVGYMCYFTSLWAFCDVQC